MRFKPSPKTLWLGGMAIAILLFAYMGTEFQRVTTMLFASPDETAVAVFADAWSWGSGFRISPGLPEDLMGFAGLHPRSMARDGDALVPVGFLGMPFLAALAEKLKEGAASYLTLFLVLSALYPLWTLAGGRKAPRKSTLTLLVFLSFPTVLLYTNRGLFPNLPVVALALWSVWGWREIGTSHVVRRTSKRILPIIAGLTLGLALFIRPVEAVWLLPWVAWAIWSEWKKERMKEYGLAGGVMILVCLFGAWLASRTYTGSVFGFLPAVGYFIRDHADASFSGSVIPEAPSSASSIRLPYGFHPRAAWENVRIYLLGYFGLWTGVALAGAFVALKNAWKKHETVVGLLVAWTLFSLLMLYGQSLYTDNIRGNVSLGNSFLRYMLPLAPFLAYGIAIAVDALWRIPMRGKVLGALATVFILAAGVANAYARDEEGIFQTRYELARYSLVRSQADSMLPEGSLILSERSDKIFASGPYVSVSPMPDARTLEYLQNGVHGVFLFHRVSDPLEIEMLFGFSEARLLFAVGNEGLYLLKSRGPDLQVPVPASTTN